MSTHPIPAELQGFISRQVRSIEQLETLCLVVDGRDKSWSATEVFNVVQSSPKSVLENLQQFERGGLLVLDSPTTYRFVPRTEKTSQLAQDLVKTYRERRITIVEAIYKVPEESIRQFSDAFKFRKDKS